MAELACLPKEFSWLHSPNTRIWRGTNPSYHGHGIYSWVHISCNLAHRQTLLNEYPLYPGSFLPAATRQPDRLGPNLSVADCLSKHSLFSLSLSRSLSLSLFLSLSKYHTNSIKDMNEGSGPSLFKNSKIPKIFGSQRWCHQAISSLPEIMKVCVAVLAPNQAHNSFF
jgi:hypothetical protein